MQWFSQITFSASPTEKEELQKHRKVQKGVMKLGQSLHQGKGAGKNFGDARRDLKLWYGLASFLCAIKWCVLSTELRPHSQPAQKAHSHLSSHIMQNRMVVPSLPKN